MQSLGIVKVAGLIPGKVSRSLRGWSSLASEARTVLDNYESAVIAYLRGNRALFVNTECCIQLNEGDNPDTSGPHWYCDAVTADFRHRRILLCEITYSKDLRAVSTRLKAWHEHWPAVCNALTRDSHLPADWPVRPWLFVPESFIEPLLERLRRIATNRPLAFVPLITPLEMVQPWHYRFWDWRDEMPKPAVIPELMQR